MSIIKRKLVDGNWTYDDKSEQSFIVAVNSIYHFDIVKFDDFLETIEKSPRGIELIEWRHEAITAFKMHNVSAVKGWLNAINASWQYAIKSDYLLPLARARDKEKKDSLKGAMERLKRDPKQIAKMEVFEEWKKWRTAKGVGRWRASFARAMLEKFPILENQKTIENWSIQWQRKYPLS